MEIKCFQNKYVHAYLYTQPTYTAVEKKGDAIFTNLLHPRLLAESWLILQMKQQPILTRTLKMFKI